MPNLLLECPALAGSRKRFFTRTLKVELIVVTPLRRLLGWSRLPNLNLHLAW